jgi:tetratricopeptide (TPR) repeat protein
MFRPLVPLAGVLALFGAAAAQDAPKLDPLTGQPAPTEETAPPAVEPAGPDLSAVTELILEGSYEEAETELAKLLAEFPDNADILLIQGEVLVAQRKLEPAVAALEKCAAIDPERPRLHFQLGSALAQLGQNARAIEEFGKELELNDDPRILTMARLNRTAIFGKEQNWDAAAAELEALIAFDPTQVQAYGDLVSFYLQAGKTDEAADALRRGAAAGFASAPHYYSVGARYFRDERMEDASAAFTKALEIDPSFARAERSLGHACERLGRNDEAVRHLQRYLELAPDAPDAKEVTALVAELIARSEKG